MSIRSYGLFQFLIGKVTTRPQYCAITPMNCVSSLKDAGLIMNKLAPNSSQRILFSSPSERGQHNHRHPLEHWFGFDLSQSFAPVHARHVQVQNNQIRPQRQGQIYTTTLAIKIIQQVLAIMDKLKIGIPAHFLHPLQAIEHPGQIALSTEPVTKCSLTSYINIVNSRQLSKQTFTFFLMPLAVVYITRNALNKTFFCIGNPSAYSKHRIGKSLSTGYPRSITEQFSPLSLDPTAAGSRWKFRSAHHNNKGIGTEPIGYLCRSKGEQVEKGLLQKATMFRTSHFCHS